MDKKIWLLTLAICCASGGSPTNWFTDQAQSRGLNFRHFHGGTGQYYLPESLGSGVALIDYDRDGDLDVLLLQGNELTATPTRPSRVYRNQLLQFTPAFDLPTPGYALGAAVGDYDQDGWDDLLVSGVGFLRLYRNQRNGSFTEAARWDDGSVMTAAAFFDADRDGDLDLLVLRYVDFTVATNQKCPDARNRLDYCQPAVYHPLPARFFKNQAGRFTESDAFAGAAGAGLGIAVADFDNDGWPDVYVANDGTPNHLWMNQRDGAFNETALAAGAAYDDQGRAQAGMGVSAADYDNDGDEDLIVANLMGETLALYENDGHAEFRHVTVERKLSRPSMPFTGFGAGWADFDHDGLLDLFIANGSVKILDELGAHPYPYGQRSQLFHNRGGYFDEIRSPALDVVAAARGAAFGDLDRDGDIDVVINNSNGPPRLLVNERAPAGQSLTIDAEAARVGVFRRGARPLWRRSTRSGSYLSSNDPAIHFGLGPQAVLERVVIEWPDGSRQEVKPPAAPRPNRLSFVNPRRRPGP